MTIKNPRHDLKTAYNRYANERDQMPTHRWRVDLRADFLRRLQAANAKTLLELGSGPGHDALYFQQNGLKVLATDLSPEMVRLCEEKGVSAETVDLSHLPFPDTAFDAIFAFNSLLHIPKSELAATLIGIRRVLKPGGLFFMGVYGGKDSEGVWLDDRYTPQRFFSYYTHDTLKNILSQHFYVETFTTTIIDGNELPHQGVFCRRLLQQAAIGK